MFANSEILNFIYRISISLKAWYAESRTAVMLKSLGLWAERIFGASAILNLLGRDGWLVRTCVLFFLAACKIGRASCRERV